MTSPSLIERLQAATAPSRELDAAITLVVERERWPHVTVRELDSRDREGRWTSLEGEDDAWAIIHGGDMGATYPVPRYSSSIDAALSLVPDGWHIKILIPPNGVKLCGVRLDKYGDVAFIAEPAQSPALALCIAALKARGLEEAREAHLKSGSREGREVKK